MIKLIKKYFELGIKKHELEIEVLTIAKESHLLSQRLSENQINWHNFKCREQQINDVEEIKYLTNKTILNEKETLRLTILMQLNVRSDI